jgi:hypothetical protein
MLADLALPICPISGWLTTLERDSVNTTPPGRIYTLQRRLLAVIRRLVRNRRSGCAMPAYFLGKFDCRGQSPKSGI